MWLEEDRAFVWHTRPTPVRDQITPDTLVSSRPTVTRGKLMGDSVSLPFAMNEAQHQAQPLQSSQPFAPSQDHEQLSNR